MANRYLHLACYNESHDHTSKGRQARFESTCASPTCKLGGKILPGQEYTWKRTPSAEVDSNAPKAPSAPVVTQGGDSITNALAAILMPAVDAKIDAAIDARLSDCDPEAIVAQAEEAIQAKLDSFNAVHRIEIVKRETGETVDVGAQHKQFKTLLNVVQARVPVWLAGPSGSGKTTAASAVARALSLPFHYTGAVSDAYALLGYNDANGKYVRTPFREACEHGGIFLWDEVDGSDPNALLAFNAVTGNRVANFPDRVIQLHADTVLIAAANTFGHGATHEYVGRLKLDAASLKRFAFLAWFYDEDLETATAPNPAWTKRVQEVRKRVAAKGIRVLVTPRESYLGAQLLATGIPQDEVENMTIRSGMTADQWASVCA